MNILHSGLMVVDDGDGAPLLLLHAEGLDSRMWEPQLGALLQRHRVIRLDERGHGGSQRVDGSHSPAADALDVLSALDLEAVTIVGALSGARHALEVALAAPECVRALVLMNAVVGLTAERLEEAAAEGVLDALPHLLEATERAQEPEGEEALVDFAFEWGWLPIPQDPHAERRLREIVQDNIGVSIDPPRIDRRPIECRDLERVTVPALVMSHDGPGARAEAEALVAALPRGELATFPASASVLSVEMPDEFNAVVLAFLERVLGGGQDRLTP